MGCKIFLNTLVNLKRLLKESAYNQLCELGSCASELVSLPTVNECCDYQQPHLQIASLFTK